MRSLTEIPNMVYSWAYANQGNVCKKHGAQIGGIVKNYKVMKRAMAKKVTLASIAEQIERGFTAAADDIADMKDDISGIKSEVTEIRAGMVTKVDYHAFRQETEENFKGVRLELLGINKQLDAIEEQYKNLKGVTKEIDDIRDRVKEIERHLGIDKKIAA